MDLDANILKLLANLKLRLLIQRILYNGAER